MYIAFKWLLSLAFTMWAAMCCFDVFRKNTTNIIEEEFVNNPFGLVYKNHSIQLVSIQDNPENLKHEAVAVWHCTMFVFGALAVFIFNKKKEIITFTMSKIIKLNIHVITETVTTYLKRTACEIGVTIISKLRYLWEILQYLCTSIGKYIHTYKRKKVQINYIVNFAILKKLKEIIDERKTLGQLLISAIHENRTIRMQYQLETMAKTRLARHIENTQKLIKDNRSRYISFQQLYLVTHQENIFLKSRLSKLMQEKDEAEKNLMGLMNEVYMSKNNELKAYCSRFIVRTRDNLLNSDVNAEIQKFLQKARCPGTNTSTNRLTDLSDLEVNTCESRPRCTDTLKLQSLGDDSLVPASTIAPKLRGLPGEYVWTVKDKDGIIEKLYEYDYESDFDNGDTIRRIRQYSVYYDKDCLLDFSSSGTVVNENKGNTSRLDSQNLNTRFTTSNEKFLTGSEVFKKFLKTNKNVMSSSAKSPSSSLLCR